MTKSAFFSIELCEAVCHVTVFYSTQPKIEETSKQRNEVDIARFII